MLTGATPGCRRRSGAVLRRLGRGCMSVQSAMRLLRLRAVSIRSATANTCSPRCLTGGSSLEDAPRSLVCLACVSCSAVAAVCLPQAGMMPIDCRGCGGASSAVRMAGYRL
ncbi:hypothetical protein BU16DRAFT_93305 [Lophium mytilinum]|uniref:Uncharacterized protein n=1 Tax=Lophium mytilinum TaxID=390894 RepID=A0A6A6QLA8_9PEZI|nr:hypothetical protein BU16DRAFT_93305 [Lophium mytilinum]